MYREEQILLGLRSSSRTSFPGVWDLPGGRQEQGESLEQTLVRELQEELGIIPIAPQYFGKIDISGQPDDLECHIFLVTEWVGTAHNLAPLEHEDIQWFAVEEACRLALASPLYPAIFRSAADCGVAPYPVSKDECVVDRGHAELFQTTNCGKEPPYNKGLQSRNENQSETASG